ncbi:MULTISPECIES: hypothetical protein [unclassified Pseudomonas]|uniref:hypothetical protein n=1 Tax=unclassified Pseudomonas TaxID=196821 RepID=UPI000480EF8D|nr:MULTISPECIES: hypothetical protein [unclassified Pseudomonas]RAS22175.1 hypothetical protein H040_04503 [Pseudomonas sp. URMO17WK12:I7]SMF61020.1 hypothetical protein SAMN02745903_04610 [Pseudomonas sp. URMO17WK12:I5]
MANNQDKERPQGGSNQANAGDAGGKGGQGGMAGTQKGGQQSGHTPEDKMSKDKDWQQKDTGHQGGQAGGKQNPADSGRMGGQASQGGTQHKDKDR